MNYQVYVPTEFIEDLSVNETKVVSKNEIKILVLKMSQIGDVLSHRYVKMPTGSKFTISKKNGKGGLLHPIKKGFWRMVLLQCNLKKEDDEIIVFEQYNMNQELFQKEFKII